MLDDLWDWWSVRTNVPSSRTSEHSERDPGPRKPTVNKKLALYLFLVIYDLDPGFRRDDEEILKNAIIKISGAIIRTGLRDTQYQYLITYKIHCV